MACPHLAKLVLSCSNSAPSLKWIRPLHRLKGLRELTLSNDSEEPAADAADVSDLDPCGLASLACLLGLRKLTLTIGDVPTLLPYLTSLTDLTDLDITSHYATTTGISIDHRGA